MRATEKVKFTGLAADSAAFTLKGGIYMVMGIVHSHSGLSFGVQQLGPDGSTYLNMITALTANGHQDAQYWPPGQYKFNVTGTPGTGETWDGIIVRVPLE